MLAGLLAAMAALVVALGVSASVAGASEGFGISSFSTSVSSSQAGAHADFTTSFAFDTEANGGVAGQAKNVTVDLPVGLVGNPLDVPRCTPAELSSYDCQPSSQVGVLMTRFAIAGEPPFEEQSAVYDMVPSPGHPATFATSISIATLLIQADVRRDGSYGLVASVDDLSTILPLQSQSLTMWGVPADPSHDALRFGPPPGYGTGVPAGVTPAPFMTNPTDCTDGPIPSSLTVESWQGQTVSATSSLPAPTGCGALGFNPSLSVSPESTTQAASPSGYAVDLRFPQETNAYALGAPYLRDAVVTLPAGTVVNPSAANGLGACSQAQIGLGNGNPVACPDSSKVGTVELSSPALATSVLGSVYVAQQGANPFGSLLAIYLAGEAEGVQVKLAGQVSLNPATGQLTTTFLNNPQLPVSEVKLSLFGGADAVLSNPTACGEARSTASLTPWSSLVPVEPTSAFTVTGCTSQFNPGFSTGTVSNQAGSYSPLVVAFSRGDQDQDLAGVSIKLPPGLLGTLKGIERCPEPQASQGTCGAGSLVGHLTAAAGAGPDPYWVQGGQAFLTGPYKGAPFGLSIVVPAVAGPFNLGNIVVRAQIAIDPNTAQVTVTTDPLPTILQGIPLQIKTVNTTIDRANFTFNPTDCEPLAVTGVLSSAQGASANVSSHFQAANCAALPYHPVFADSTQAKTSKQNGASLTVRGTFPAGNANTHSVAVTLPKQLPARLTTIQQACPEAAFDQNPASCPAGSNIGIGTATTPILANPVTGPAYLVSHGGAAFPDLVVILQGEGVTVDLVGSIDIKKGITSSTFATVPDAPIGTFELNLPEGPHSGLAAVLPAKAKSSLCGTSLAMPFTSTGQNGAVVRQNVKIAVTGCPKPKAKKKAKARKGKRKG